MNINYKELIQSLASLVTIGLAAHVTLAAIWLNSLFAPYDFNLLACIDYRDLLFSTIPLNTTLSQIVLCIIVPLYIIKIASLVSRDTIEIDYKKRQVNNRTKLIVCVLSTFFVFSVSFISIHDIVLSVLIALITTVEIMYRFFDIRFLAGSSYIFVVLLILKIQHNASENVKPVKQHELKTISFQYKGIDYENQVLIYGGYKSFITRDRTDTNRVNVFPAEKIDFMVLHYEDTFARTQNYRDQKTRAYSNN